MSLDYDFESSHQEIEARRRMEEATLRQNKIGILEKLVGKRINISFRSNAIRGEIATTEGILKEIDPTADIVKLDESNPSHCREISINDICAFTDEEG